MAELISRKAIESIVLDSGSDSSIMDYRTWDEDQFKKFMVFALYKAINSIDKKALAALLNAED